MWQQIVGGSLWLGAVACVRVAPTPSSVAWISSDASQYSPVARLRVDVHLTGRQLGIAIDSGVLTIPGEQTQLYLTAIVATLDSSSVAVTRTGTDRYSTERRGWKPIATSDSAFVISELHYGESASLRPLRLSVAMPDADAAQPLWLIFRISGNGVAYMAPLGADTSPRRREIPGGVRVYACGDRDIRGRFDQARGALLKRAYGVAC
jgi:hypothetical protein